MAVEGVPLRGLEERLAAAGRAGLARKTVPRPDGLDFMTNDYLGLLGRPELAEAAAEAAARWGTGAGGSRLLGGDRPPHRRLEEALAEWKGTEAALVFPSGWQANAAALSALLREGDGVWSDSLNHASIIDGLRLSKANRFVFPHGDLDELERSLARHRSSCRTALIVVEGVYSMDGDVCDLPALRETALRHDAVLYVDDAHGTGTLPPRGRGVFDRFGMRPLENEVVMGTLSKALASQGGFVCCTARMREYLVNFSRGFIFSTGLCPPAAAAALAALELFSSDGSLFGALRRNCGTLAEGLRSMGLPASDETPIFPVVLGEPYEALAAARFLADRGIHAGAVRPPAVPEGSSRLRATVSARHTEKDLQRLLDALSAFFELRKGGRT